MAVRSTTLQISTQPQPIAAGDDQDFNTDHRDVIVTNTGAGTVHLGGPDVTTTDGFPLAAGATVSFDRITRESIPHAVAAASSTLAVLEVGV